MANNYNGITPVASVNTNGGTLQGNMYSTQSISKTAATTQSKVSAVPLSSRQNSGMVYPRTLK